ncbi:hypothetical protein H7J83_17325 [Mycobacterium mantenii]|nr:hypothetical protein [Mycobacterium mantenii]
MQGRGVGRKGHVVTVADGPMRNQLITKSARPRAPACD